MRALLVPAALAVMVAASPLAFAAESATGTIKSLDMKAHTVTLNDGTTYYLASGFKDPGLKSGQKVRVDWNMQGGKHEASGVTIVN